MLAPKHELVGCCHPSHKGTTLPQKRVKEQAVAVRAGKGRFWQEQDAGCRGRGKIHSSLRCLLDASSAFRITTDVSRQEGRRLQTHNVIYFQNKRTATSQENGNGGS